MERECSSVSAGGWRSLPALAVCQGDPLGGHLELDHRGGGPRAPAQGGVRCLGDGLGPRERLGLHGVQVQDVTGWREGQRQGLNL